MGFRTDTSSIRSPLLGGNLLRRPLESALLEKGSFALVMLIYFLISLGGLVRNEGAGLSCPDWPLCFGHVVPPMNYQVFLEWFHRLIAGSVSATLLLLSGFIFYNPHLRYRLGKYCALALLLLAAQVVLGGMTVLGLLSPKWVSSHLMVGLAFFGTILWLSLEVRNLNYVDGARKSHPWLFRGALLTILVLYGQIFLGGLVSSNYAGLACPDFPKCHGDWIPPFIGQIRLHMLHRIGAIVASVTVMTLCVSVWRKGIQGKAWVTSRFIPMLLALQVFLGVGSVLWQLPILMSVAHLAVATALFAMLVVTTYEIRRS